MFEEGKRHRLATQRRQLFQRVPLDFLERLALIEKKAKFVRRERFEGEQIAEAVRQCPISQHKRGNSKKKSKSTPLDPPARRALPCRFRGGRGRSARKAKPASAGPDQRARSWPRERCARCRGRHRPLPGPYYRRRKKCPRSAAPHAEQLWRG